jgi:hypothetical protein
MPGYVEDAGRVVSDLEMMRKPEWWPNLILPLKRPNWEVAVLLSDDGTLFMFFPGQTMFEHLDPAKMVGPFPAYMLETVVTDHGWMVD